MPLALRSVPHGLLLAVAHARRFPVVPKVCCHTVGRVTFCEQLKTEGNELFAKKQWGAAADKYRAAIAVAFPPPKKALPFMPVTVCHGIEEVSWSA